MLKVIPYSGRSCRAYLLPCLKQLSCLQEERYPNLNQDMEVCRDATNAPGSYLQYCWQEGQTGLLPVMVLSLLSCQMHLLRNLN